MIIVRAKKVAMKNSEKKEMGKEGRCMIIDINFCF